MPRGNGKRDPRSVEYDPAVRAVLIQAIRQSRQRKGVITWIPSPARQFRNKDAGGRTAEERAFTRACYYQIFAVPRALGVVPDYGLRLTWNETETEPSSHGRRARAVQVRLYRYGSAYKHAEDKTEDPWWVEMAETGDTSFRRPSRSLPPRSTPPPPGKLTA